MSNKVCKLHPGSWSPLTYRHRDWIPLTQNRGTKRPEWLRHAILRSWQDAVAEQAEALLPYLARYLPAKRKAVIVPLAILFAVGWFSWIAAIILLATAPLIPLFAALVGWRAKAASESHMVELGGMHAYLLDRLRGLATIRGLGAVDATANRLRQRADDLRIRIMAVLKIAFLSSAALELFAALGVALVAIYVGFHLLGQLNFGTWHGRLSLGEALFVLLLSPSFFEPLRELASVWHDRAAGEAARSSLARLSAPGLPLPGSSLASDSRSDNRGGAPSVVLSGIRFSHAGTGATAVEQYDLHVRAGEHVALVGPSGTGKSTPVTILLPSGSNSATRSSIRVTPFGHILACARHRIGCWLEAGPDERVTRLVEMLLASIDQCDRRAVKHCGEARCRGQAGSAGAGDDDLHTGFNLDCGLRRRTGDHRSDSPGAKHQETAAPKSLVLHHDFPP